jgi:hypothetical protein
VPASNDSVAYADDNGVGGIWIVNPNQTPVELDSSPNDTDVAISPDGSTVACTREDPALTARTSTSSTLTVQTRRS